MLSGASLGSHGVPTRWSWHSLRVALAVQWLKFPEQRPIEVVVASHHQLRVEGALLVGGVGLSTDLSDGVLPPLQERLGDLALRLVGGLLSRETSALAPLHGVLARAEDLGFPGVDGHRQKDHARGDQQVSHRDLVALRREVEVGWCPESA